MTGKGAKPDRWQKVEAAMIKVERELEQKLPPAEPKVNKALKNVTGRYTWPEN